MDGMDDSSEKLIRALGTERERRREPLSSTVRTALRLYFNDLGEHSPAPIYRMVIAEVERPMFETVMKEANGNQSRAAQMLGISRSTLRKKLKEYNLEE